MKESKALSFCSRITQLLTQQREIKLLSLSNFGICLFCVALALENTMRFNIYFVALGNIFASIVEFRDGIDNTFNLGNIAPKYAYLFVILDHVAYLWMNRQGFNYFPSLSSKGLCMKK